MLLWIRRRADPDECLAILFCLVYLWAGVSTWQDLIGHPRDAPFLRIPGEIRSFGWWISGITAVAVLRLPRNCRARRRAHVMLAFMPGLRLGSYLASWICSWGWVDALVPDDWIKGDPKAYGSMWLYVCIEILVMCQLLAPWDWHYLDEKLRRPGRLERRR